MEQTGADVLAGLAEILAEIIGIEPGRVTPGLSFADDLDVDSLTVAEMIVAAEDRQPGGGVLHQVDDGAPTWRGGRGGGDRRRPGYPRPPGPAGHQPG